MDHRLLAAALVALGLAVIAADVRTGRVPGPGWLPLGSAAPAGRAPGKDTGTPAPVRAAG